jgi:hypothetical protein
LGASFFFIRSAPLGARSVCNNRPAKRQLICRAGSGSV